MVLFKLLLFVTCNGLLHTTSGFKPQSHPCKRNCVEGETTICNYELTLENYFTAMPECLDCLQGNASDCYNPRCIPADGRKRLVKVFNHQLPGTAIEVCEGDLVKVKVINKLSNEETTSVHWHGIHQRSSQWMDGVPMITQCPITTSFEYEFVASPAGTHFYHSHTGGQRTDGAFGALVVRQDYDNQPHKYHYDLSEHTITVTDWYNISSEYHYLDYYRNNIHYRNSATAILVNGFGAQKGNKVPNKTFIVKRGKTYRFRIIHAGALVCPITLSVDGHTMEVISADGQDVTGVAVDKLTLTNGERYDFILNANRTPGQYKMTFTGGMYCEGLTTFAVLEYKGYKDKHGPSKLKKATELNCVEDRDAGTTCIDVKDLRSTKKLEGALKSKPAKQFYLAFGMFNHVLKEFQGPNDAQLFGMFVNNISFVTPKSPLLETTVPYETCNFERPRNCQGSFCECTHVVEVKNPGSTVELIFADEGSDTDEVVHPIHLHGYNFRVIAQGRLDGPVTNSSFHLADKRGEIKRNFDNPPLKDTVVIPDEGYTVVRFIADNPGYWILHCHVDYHMEAGMRVALKIGDTRKIGVPHNLPKC